MGGDCQRDFLLTAHLLNSEEELESQMKKWTKEKENTNEVRETWNTLCMENTISRSSILIEEWGSEKGETINLGVWVELEHRTLWLMLGTLGFRSVFRHNLTEHLLERSSQVTG